MCAAPLHVRPRAERLAEGGANTRRLAASVGPASLAKKAGFALVTLWAVGATWTAYDGKRKSDRLRLEQSEMRAEYEDKVRALIRRMVGVASHQALEQDGLGGRMADLITRQVELENRQAILTSLAEQAGIQGLPPQTGSGDLGGTAQPAVNRKTFEPAAPDPVLKRPAETGPSVPTLRLGPRESTDPPGRASGYTPITPRSPAAPDPYSASARPAPGPGGASEQLLRPQSQLSIHEQFARLESSLGRVEFAQVRALDGFSRMSQSQAALVRTALGDVGLDPSRIVPPPPKGGVGGPLIPFNTRHATDPFQAGVVQVQKAFEELARLRPVVNAVPFRRPLEGDDNLTSNFGVRLDPFTGASAMHSGMDFRAEEGTPVQAAGAGRVVTASPTGGYGNLVEIDHGNGLTTRYGHLSSIEVSLGQSVAAGGAVGQVGSTGRSTGPHLHYETRVGGSAVDPQRFLSAGSKLFGGRATRTRSATRSLSGEIPAAASELPAALHALD